MLTNLKLFTIITICSILSLYFSSCTSTEQMTARISYAQNDFVTCEKESLKETQTNPMNEEGWGYLTMSSMQLKKVDQAKDAYDHYIKIGKFSMEREFSALYEEMLDKGDGEFNIGVKQNDSLSKITLSDAKKYFLQAYILGPDSSDVIVNLGLTDEILGQKDEALTFYKKALDKNKNDTLAASGLGRMAYDKAAELLKEKKYEECVNTLLPVINSILHKNSPIIESATLEMGVVYFSWAYDLSSSDKVTPADSLLAIEKFKSAIPYLESLLASSSYDIKTNAYKVLALCYAGANENAKAVETNEQYKKMLNTPEEIVADYFLLKDIKAETGGNVKISGEATCKSRNFKTAAFKITIYDISNRDNDKLLETVSFVINDIKQGDKKAFEVTTNSPLEMKNLKYRISFDNANSQEVVKEKPNK